MSLSVPTVTALLGGAESGSEPAFVSADDGHLYWMKPQGNPHGPTSLLAERIVSAAGDWLEAPVVTSSLLHLPAELAAQVRFRDATVARPGLAHGSLAIRTVSHEGRELKFLGRDSNSTRGARFIALWEWCGGEDAQFLYDAQNRSSLYSFDHGMWLGGGGDWKPADLLQQTAYVPSWSHSLSRLSSSEFLNVADKLETFDEAAARSLADSVPVEWGLEAADVFIVTDWLQSRAPQVARHLRNLSSHATGS